jgi:hypothetical protein
MLDVDRKNPFAEVNAATGDEARHRRLPSYGS